MSVLVLAWFVYVFLNIVQVWSVGRSDSRKEVDAIVVMGVAQYDGRPSPQLQARLDHVLTLWKEGVAPLVVTTGGNQHDVKLGKLQGPLRIAITGRTVGPPLFEPIELLGREESQRRIRAALVRAAG